MQERSLEEYKRLLEAATLREKDLESIIRRLEKQARYRTCGPRGP
jgi:uncharacterized protein with von Willebrand factor type A (vWA) domain